MACQLSAFTFTGGLGLPIQPQQRYTHTHTHTRTHSTTQCIQKEPEPISNAHSAGADNLSHPPHTPARLLSVLLRSPDAI